MKHKSMPAFWMAVCLLLFASMSAQAQFEKNLVVNGDAEAGPASADGSVVASVPGWTRTGNLTVVRYGSGFADPGPFLHGGSFFAGGPDNASSSATQTIDVSPYTGSINKGITFSLSGYLGNFLGQIGSATLTATFLDAGGAVLKSVTASYDIIPYQPYQLFHVAKGMMPLGTTSVVVRLDMTRRNGSYNDAFADNISFVLHAPKLDISPLFTPWQPQLALVNAQTQQVGISFLTGEQSTAFTVLNTTLPDGWQVAGAGDFADHSFMFISFSHFSNLVLQNPSTGQVAFWYLSGSVVTQGMYANQTLPAGWSVAGVGDIDGDGNNDLVLYNSTTQQVAFWFMVGTTVVDGAYATMPDGSDITLPPDWQVAGATDIDGDGHVDVVLQNPITGEVAFWFLNNNLVTDGAVANQVLPHGWQVAGTGDYNGDGISDLVLQNPSTNETALWYLGGVHFGIDQLIDYVYVNNGSFLNLGQPAAWSIVGPR